MTRASRSFLLSAIALGLVACTDKMITLSEGTNSTLSVRVYVDADGDGAFDAAADVAISGVTVSTTGTADLSDTTGADGVASFELAPGSYTLAVAGDVPTGAVLATATNPVAVAQFQGGTLTSEFRYSFIPGILAGVVFRDEDANGVFDAGTDTPAGGLSLTLLSGTDTVGTGATATDGTFMFTTLRPGDFSLVITPFPTITLVGGNSVAVTISPDAQTNLEIEFTGNLVIPVADARNAADGDAVAIEGVVSWQAQFRTTLDAFMQDGSAGMTLFDFNQPAVTIGDSIRVVGRKGTFRGEVQIDSVFTLEVLANVGEPTATLVTAADINAGSFQSQFVTIDGTVDSLTADFFDNARVYLTDGAGDTFVAESDSRTGVASTDWAVGLLYTVNGVLGSDDRDALQYRLETRSIDDLIAGGSAVTVAEARMMVGQEVTVEATLTWQAEWQTGRLEGFMQDGTAGIALFDFGVDPTGLQRGDRLRIRGTVSAFRGEVQLGNSTVFSVVGTDPLPTPRAVTAAEINAPMFQGELVTITGTADSVQADFFDNARVFMTDGAGDTFVVESDSRSGIVSADWVVGNSYTVTGLLGFDDRDGIPARLEVRDANDM